MFFELIYVSGWMDEENLGGERKQATVFVYVELLVSTPVVAQK
jgi:hypothetical protein